MKKILLVLIAFAIVFAGCSTENNDEPKTTLTIINSTDFNGVQPNYGEVDFGMMSRGKKVTKEVEAGTNFVYIMLTANSRVPDLGEHTSMYEMADVVVCEELENTVLTLTNTTTISFLGGSSGYIEAGGASTGTLKSIFDAYIRYMNE